MKLSRWILAVLLALVACSTVTIHGVTPISPEPGSFDWTGRPTAVESLQPTFRWEPVDERDARYDFVIYESHSVLFAAVGREVYYREGLTEPEHTLEVPLQPNREYYWSVRVRRGEEVSEWSRFDYTQVPGGCAMRRQEEYPLFWFRTPRK